MRIAAVLLALIVAAGFWVVSGSNRAPDLQTADRGPAAPAGPSIERGTTDGGASAPAIRADRQAVADEPAESSDEPELRPEQQSGCTLRITVMDSNGERVPRYGILLGADSRTREGAGVELTHSGHHDEGELLVDGLEPGPRVLRVVPLDALLPPSEATLLNLLAGDNRVTVHVDSAWPLSVSVASEDGVAVPRARVEVIAGSERGRAKDVNALVWSGGLIPNAAQSEGPVRIAEARTGRDGEADFVLPRSGMPVAVRVTSPDGRFLPAFVHSVPRGPASSEVDVVVASGATVNCLAIGALDRLGEVELALRRESPIEGGINAYPVQWHLRRPGFEENRCVLHAVPHGRWLVDVFVDGTRRAEALGTWDIAAESADFVLDLNRIAPAERSVRLSWAEEPRRASFITLVDEAGGSTVLDESALPCDMLTHARGTVFAFGVVRSPRDGRVQQWYSNQRFAEGAAIEGELRAWSLRVNAASSAVGKDIEVRGPAARHIVRARVEAAGPVVLEGVCPFDSKLMVGDRAIMGGADLERAILQGQAVDVR